MSNGNGSDTLESFLRSSTDEYAGVENRLDSGTRLVFDKLIELQSDVKELKNHKENCNIHPELVPHQGHIVGVIKEASDDGVSVEKGLNAIAGQNRFTRNTMRMRSKVIERVVLIFAGALAVIALKKMGWV